MPQKGELLCNKYRILDRAGKGGMSAVYRVRDEETNREYAIKLVEKKDNEKSRTDLRSLRVEGETLKKLENPHLPRVYETIETENELMMVMDFVEGESLDKRIARQGGQTEPYIINWGIQLCDVLSYLHNQKPPIIYRDLKPANIILQPDGNLVLVDFGAVRTWKSDQKLSSDTICIGSEGFASPEQYGGLGESDARTDIYCLGATLYNLFTGQMPKIGLSPVWIEEQVDPALNDSPLREIIEKCTQSTPADRYQTAVSLRTELDAVQAGLSPRREKKPATVRRKPADTGADPWRERRDSRLLLRSETPEAAAGPWKKLMLIAAAAAMLLLIAGVVLTLLGTNTAAAVFLIFACAAAVLAAAGAIGTLREK